MITLYVVSAAVDPESGFPMDPFTFLEPERQTIPYSLPTQDAVPSTICKGHINYITVPALRALERLKRERVVVTPGHVAV